MWCAHTPGTVGLWSARRHVDIRVDLLVTSNGCVIHSIVLQTQCVRTFCFPTSSLPNPSTCCQIHHQSLFLEPVICKLSTVAHKRLRSSLACACARVSHAPALFFWQFGEGTTAGTAAGTLSVGAVLSIVCVTSLNQKKQQVGVIDRRAWHCTLYP